MFGPQRPAQRVLSEAHTKAIFAVLRTDGQERPLTTAALGFTTGVAGPRIGLLYDVHIARPLSGAIAPNAFVVAALGALRSFRKAFNRIPVSADGQMATEKLARALIQVERRLEESAPSQTESRAFSVVFRHAATTLLTANRHISLEAAREVAAYILGACASITLKDVRFGVDSVEQSCRNSPTFSPRAPENMTERVKPFLRLQRQLAHRATKKISSASTEAPALDNRARLNTSDYEDGHAHVFRSAPVHFVAASRRSLMGIKLATAHGLNECISAFQRDPSIQTLTVVKDALSTWRAGEGFASEGQYLIGRNNHLGRDPQLFGCNLFSIPGSSHQSVLREVAKVAIDWALERSSSLSEQTRKEVLSEVQILLDGLARALHALTAREMLETLSVMSFPKDIDDNTGGIAWRVKKPFWGSRWLETGSLGLLLGTHEASPFDRCSRMANLPLRKIDRVLSDLRGGAQDAAASIGTASDAELSGLRRLTNWITAVAARFEKRVPKVPSHKAIWISEYDGGDGVTLPGDTQKHFEEMQKAHLVNATATASGLVNPETTEWLRNAIDNHDGFLLTINEGDPQKPLSRSEPEALFVVTCSQNNPSPILPKLKECGQEFFDRLPKTRSGSVPMVVGELVVMTQTGSNFVRDYGEAPLEMLIHQAEFNVISRFAECERVDSVGICRADSVALKAYKRYGYIDTDTTYTDEHGTVFRIVYKPLFPIDVILGYRDINE